MLRRETFQPSPDALAALQASADDAELSDAVDSVLSSGLAAGMNPNVVASQLGGLLNGAQALTMARSEMLGAYRDAALFSYNANSDVVSGWMWSASAGACVACSEEDGQVFELSEDMDGMTHWCCRCSPIPITLPWADILGPAGIDASGIEETNILADYVPLSDTFSSMSFEEQAAMLGSKSAAAAVRDGMLSPHDFLGHIEGGPYDGRIYTKSLKEALADKGKSKAEIEAIRADLLQAVKSLQELGAGDALAFSARTVTGGEAVSHAAAYTLTAEDRAFAQALRDQIPAGGITSADEALALGQQVRERIEGDLADLKGWAQEAADIRLRAPNLTDAERAWVSGDKDATAAHGGVRFMDVQKTYQDAYQAQARAYLADVRDVGGGALRIASDPSVDSYVAQQLENASHLLPSDWVQASNDLGEMIPLRLRDASGADGYYQADGARSGNGFINLRYNKSYNDAYVESSALHELTHRMEAVLPTLGDIQQQFYDARTAGEAFVDLTNGINMWTKLDQWLDQYLGRQPLLSLTKRAQPLAGATDYRTATYVESRSFELLTMGAEMLFAPGVDVTGWALINDPEFVQFVLGVFLGVKP